MSHKGQLTSKTRWRMRHLFHVFMGPTWEHEENMQGLYGMNRPTVGAYAPCTAMYGISAASQFQAFLACMVHVYTGLNPGPSSPGPRLSRISSDLFLYCCALHSGPSPKMHASWLPIFSTLRVALLADESSNLVGPFLTEGTALTK